MSDPNYFDVDINGQIETIPYGISVSQALMNIKLQYGVEGLFKKKADSGKFVVYDGENLDRRDDGENEGPFNEYIFKPHYHQQPALGAGNVDTSSPYSNIDALRGIVRSLVFEVLKESKEYELPFSACSSEKLLNYLEGLNVGLVRSTITASSTTAIEFNPFKWMDTEEKDTSRAIIHLENELKKFGITFGEGCYELYDVHTNKTLLNVLDRKTGKLIGGTDLILGPYGLIKEGIVQQSCVAIELKTSDDVKNNGLDAYNAEAILELIASNYHSNQMSVVLLTDLCSKASIYSLKRNEDDSISIVLYENVTITQSVKFITDHLINNCVPHHYHKLQLTEKNTDIILHTFKKARKTPFEDSIVFEHFQDMLQDTEPGTRERAEVINEFYRANDYPPSAFLSMYTRSSN